MKRKVLLWALTILILVTNSPITVNASGLASNVVLSGFGGGKGSGGTAVAGQWNIGMQGIRVTIVNHYGEPAFEFRGRDSLDIIFDSSRLGTVTHYMDGNKLGSETHISPSLDGINAYVVTLQNLQNMINSNNHDTVIHTEAKPNLEKKLTSLYHPLISTNNTWKVQGEKIFNFLNDWGDPSKMGPNASLRTILNIYKISNGEAEYLWQPKETITTI